jgi:hypothetical protein
LRRKLSLLTFIAPVVAFAIGVSASSDAATRKSRSTSATCMGKAFTLSGLTDLSKGYDIGLINCSNPLGHGMHRDSFVQGGHPRHFLVKFREYFNEGTVYGTFRLGLGVKATGPFEILGGTGAFRAVRGSGQISCLFVGGPYNESDCTTKVTVKGLSIS